MTLFIPEALHQRLRALGAGAVASEQVVRTGSPPGRLTPGTVQPTTFSPKRLRDGLADLRKWLDDTARVASAHPAQDGSVCWSMALADAHTVETVLLPRDGVCVSTQVGCAVGCTFCMTGRDGLLRQLTAMEILAQVARACSAHRVRKVVFMGMGEPAHNLEAVLQAIGVLGTSTGVGHKNLVFSTVGDRRVFEQLPLSPVRPALALSLHTINPALRQQLLPRAPRLEPAELIELGESYARQTGYPIQYQWTLIEGVNDGNDEADALAELLAGKYAVMNFIPVNAVAGTGFRRPAPERAIELVRRLRSRGVLATLRQSAGQDVDAGCGQLRSRTLQDHDTGTQVVRFAKSGRLD